MKSTFASALLASAVAAALVTSSASAVTNYTETFDSDASNWVNGGFAAVTHIASGGIANSGYISYSPDTFTTGPDGGFPGSLPLSLMFRGNDASNASGDAFVGNWLADGVYSFSLAIRHNYSSTLSLYTRFAPPTSSAGAGASLAANVYEIAPNTWTTITIPITDSNPPFTSYGGGPNANFNYIFSNIQNLQIGLYLPASSEIAGLTVDLDNVAVAVPEPTTFGLAGVAALGLLARRRRRTA